MNRTYYEDELSYFREVAPEFARAHPEIASLLAHPGSDPDIERLLEGMAFLCGRVRQKLDDELPELTASLMSLLWPHYLRPIPSMSVLELQPELDAMQGPLLVPQGAEFASVPLESGTRCRYRSCWPTLLRPWRLGKVRVETAPAHPVRMVLGFESSTKAKLADLQLDRVRLHLAGDPQVSFLLYLLLTRHVADIAVTSGTGDEASRHRFMLDPADVTAAGLDDAERVLPYPPYAFTGFRLIQEYFAFKQRFLFVDIAGLDRAVAHLKAEGNLRLEISFNHRPESLPLVGPEHVRLHCVPIINLVKCAAEPIRMRFDRTRYPLQPAGGDAGHRQDLSVFSVDEVTGVSHAGGTELHPYLPFYSFRHDTAAGRVARFYQTSLENNVFGGDPRMGTDTYISFVMDGDPDRLPAEETISVELTCTHRHLPALLRTGDIVEPTDNSPAGIKFRNLLKPTPTIWPPLGRGLHWRLIAHLALNQVSLAETEHFRNLLRVYDFQAEWDAQKALEQQRLLDGIVSIRCLPDERMLRGGTVRGSQIDLVLHEDHFAGEGDACLFAAILDRFMGAYASLNAYTQLTVRLQRSGRIYEFPVRWGEQLTPARVA